MVTDQSCDIRFITRKWAPAVGGMETYCLRLVEVLRRSRSLDLIALPGRADGRAPAAPALLRFGFVTALRLLGAPRARVVHVSEMASWPLAAIAALRHPSSAIVLSAHGSDVSYVERGGVMAWLYGRYLGLGARLLRRGHVIANSTWVAELVRNAGFGSVEVIPLATGLHLSEIAVAATSDLLFAGRITAGKGLRFIVEQVLPLLPEEIRLRVAGTVWEESERALLSSPRVDYLGSLFAPELSLEFGKSLCVVVPSLMPEGFGLVAIEAASCGGVVIASDHSGLAEAVLPENGFLVPAGDAACWANKIIEISQWPAAKRAQFIEASLATAGELFTWDRLARATIAAYNRTQQGSGSPDLRKS